MMIIFSNPNEGPRPVPVEWPEYDPDNKAYLVQSGDMRVATLSPTYIDNYHFWTEVWPTLLERDGERSYLDVDCASMEQRELVALAEALLSQLGYDPIEDVESVLEFMDEV